MSKTYTIPAAIQAQADEIMTASRARFGHDLLRMERTVPEPRLPSEDVLNALRDGQGVNGMGVSDAANAAKADVFACMEKLMKTADAENRTFRASESRTYDQMQNLFNELEDIEQRNKVNRSGVIAPANRHEDYREGQPLAKGQTFVGAMRALNRIPDVQDEDLSFGKYLRGALTGRWDDARNEMQVHNALSGASTSAGGILIPEILTGQIIDLARAQTRVVQAGAQIVPMANRKVVVPKWVTDPTPEWRGENDPFAEDDGAMDSLELVAHGLGVVTKASLELIEDTDIEGQLEAAFAKSFALKIDQAALYADGTDDAPVGLKATAGVTKTPLATNGATPTWAALVDSVGRVRDQNEEPNAQIMADRTARTLAMLAGSDGQYIAPPSYLDDVTRYSTGQVPTNLTTGTSTGNTSDVFTGDWSKLLIGVRSELRIFVLKERYLPDAGQIGFVCHWRGDFGVSRPRAFDIVTGVKA